MLGAEWFSVDRSARFLAESPTGVPFARTASRLAADAAVLIRGPLSQADTLERLRSSLQRGALGGRHEHVEQGGERRCIDEGRSALHCPHA